ncbi:DUF2232 domain-containing protein [Dictyobacter formicarum]|uniref:DUF2232 domain-containing protein n=1 Tax=Dictyobacter formicarum TaxID=2778368 RepID=A0ABQ3VGH2_9CHLR|nr:DUF2232 domain-containing protein [Dictyobacter formicarum]GHO84814.1 hypothetical protein KSZ_28200 [Dictyobacter formicarum]
MFRNLRAIEIAEGALLADIAVAFQFMVAFLPVGAGFFVFLNFVVFTVLVLRRGLYVAVMGIMVAICLLCILIGPHGATSLVTEGLAGLFLGLTMKYRLPHLLIVLLGALCGSLYLFVLIIGVAWLTGVPFDTYVRSMHRAYQTILPIMALVAQRLWLGAFWQQHLYPLVVAVAQWGFAHWMITFYVVLFCFFIPALLIIYAVANSFVRLLGYDIRPLLEGKVGRWVHRSRRRVITFILKRKARGRRWSKA